MFKINLSQWSALGMAFVFGACQQTAQPEQNNKQPSITIPQTETAEIKRGDDLPKAPKLADLSGKNLAQINQFIGVYRSEIRDYSAQALRTKAAAFKDSEARRIEFYGKGRVQRLEDELKIKLDNRFMSLKNQFGEDITPSLSNSIFYEFLAFFEEDQVFMVRQFSTGESVKDNYLEEYLAYDARTGRRLFGQSFGYPSISPDGKTAAAMTKDDKGAVISFMSVKEGTWKNQTMNIAFDKIKPFDALDWANSDTLLLKSCPQAQSSCERVAQAYYVNGRWFKE